MIDDQLDISDHEYAFPIDAAISGGTSDYESRLENENPYNSIEEPFDFVRNSCYVAFRENNVKKLKVADEYSKVLPKYLRDNAASCATTHRARTKFDEYATVLPKSQRHQHGVVHKGDTIDPTKNGPCDSTNANGEEKMDPFNQRITNKVDEYSTVLPRSERGKPNNLNNEYSTVLPSSERGKPNNLSNDYSTVLPRSAREITLTLNHE